MAAMLSFRGASLCDDNVGNTHFFEEGGLLLSLLPPEIELFFIMSAFGALRSESNGS